MATGIRCILGTMTFGSQVDREGSRAMVQRFLRAGHRELDTAYIYNEGKTETILGSVLPDDTFYLATKAHPQVTGKLDGDAVTMQLEETLQRLGRDAVDLLYLHMPDPRTPIEETLERCADLYEQGRFTELGLSNYPAWLVVHIRHLCNEHGWPTPSVYQGMYNGLSRRPETELFPALRNLGMRFYAYNPLAGGMLAGKYSDFGTKPSSGRFTIIPAYLERYWKRSIFTALETFTGRCGTAGIKPAAAAIRWLVHHSLLDANEDDGIILGASSMEQLEENLAALSAGPLPEGVLRAFDAAWAEARPESPEYFRFYTP